MSQVKKSGLVRFEGVGGDLNVSAIALWKDFAFLASDELVAERNVVQVFRRAGDGFNAVPDGFIDLDASTPAKNEMDLEGLSIDGDTLYVLGSHSAKRKKVEAEADWLKNRKRLQSAAEAQPSRDVLFAVGLSESAGAAGIRRHSLRPVLDSMEPFKSFVHIAGKENGVDAEGLAAVGSDLYVGFRGPVLRGNYAVVLKCRASSPTTEPQCLFLNLDGCGVRDLAPVEGGLLVLSGPVGDGPGAYGLWFWDGQDGVPGEGSPNASLKHLGDIPVPAGAKAEGLAVVDGRGSKWRVIVVFDGMDEGNATEFTVTRSQPG